jgi:hypothetical protein
MLTKYRGNISWLKVVSWILQNTSTDCVFNRV